MLTLMSVKLKEQRTKEDAGLLRKKHGDNWLTGKDYDHSKGRFTSVKNNRGEYGKGTK
jgi:hypothetical protein